MLLKILSINFVSSIWFFFVTKASISVAVMLADENSCEESCVSRESGAVASTAAETRLPLGALYGRK